MNQRFGSHLSPLMASTPHGSRQQLVVHQSMSRRSTVRITRKSPSQALAGHPFRCYCWMYDGQGIWLLHVPNDDFDQTELWRVFLTGNVISKTRLGSWSQLFGATKKGVLICDWDRTNADSGNLFLIDPTTQWNFKSQLVSHDPS